jgi:hypothetical protein
VLAQALAGTLRLRRTRRSEARLDGALLRRRLATMAMAIAIPRRAVAVAVEQVKRTALIAAARRRRRCFDNGLVPRPSDRRL